MKRFSLGCLGLVVLPVLLIVAVGIGSASRPGLVSGKPALTAPTQVGDWSAPGSNLTTEPFTLAGSSARLDYRIDQIKDGSTAQLCVTVKKRDGSTVKADCYQQHGTTRLYLQPGTYYLEIRSVSGPWSLTLTDLP